MKYEIKLVVFSLFIFGLMSYWGIRAPDSEVVFRTTQALSEKGSFAISEQLAWKGFGVAEGKDGQPYSLFGPGEAIAALPLLKIAEAINQSEWYLDAPLLVGKSHYYGSGIVDYMNGDSLSNPEPHALRTLMGVFNIFIGALCVLVFYRTIKLLTQSGNSALFSTILFSFGTLILPYSGTFFSELLATLFVMLSFLLLLRRYLTDTSYPLHLLLAAGISLGLAVLTHISAILFAPFFFILGSLPSKKEQGSSFKKLLSRGVIFSLGLAVFLLIIAYYNFTRFGNPLETGRTLGSIRYATWVVPWKGLQGLLFSAGKGFVFYCPAIILGIYSWTQIQTKHRALSWILIAAITFRLIFIASRSDWSGGLCLGPRYLIMLIPFLVLPTGIMFDKILRDNDIKKMMGFGIATFLCIVQQIYFSLGDVFSYWRSAGMHNGVNLFKGGLIYQNWEISPLFHLMEGRRGPLLLSSVKLSNFDLLTYLVLLAGLILMFSFIRILGSWFKSHD